MNLNTKTAGALKLPAGKTDFIAWDTELKGFGYRLRAGASGKVLKSWIVQYRRAGGHRRMTLGPANVLSADQARGKAKTALAKVALGEDPQAELIDRRVKDAHNLRAVVEEYLAAKEPKLRPRTFVETKRYLTDAAYFGPLHSLPIDAITRKDVAGGLVAITRASSSIVAARARAVLSAFYVWSMQMGYCDLNPTVGTIKPESSEGRTRVLTDAELAAVWRAAGDMAGDNEYGRVVQLMVLTAARRQEVGGMSWSELDADAGSWTIPKERSKNKRAHTLPLPPGAWDIIAGVPKMVGRDCLFGMRAAGYSNWGAGKLALDKNIDITPAWTLHDIRRTVATGMANLGVQPHIVEMVLNHQGGFKAGVAGVYNRASYSNEVRTALAMWADHVRALTEGERKILPFGTAAAS